MVIKRQPQIMASIVIVGALLLFVAGCSFSAMTVNAKYADAVTAIDEYIAENGLDIRRDSPQYELFLRDVAYWEQHPQLTNGEMGDLVRAYAHAYLTNDTQGLDTTIDAPLVDGDERPVDP